MLENVSNNLSDLVTLSNTQEQRNNYRDSLNKVDAIIQVITHIGNEVGFLTRLFGEAYPQALQTLTQLIQSTTPPTNSNQPLPPNPSQLSSISQTTLQQAVNQSSQPIIQPTTQLLHIDILNLSQNDMNQLSTMENDPNVTEDEYADLLSNITQGIEQKDIFLALPNKGDMLQYFITNLHNYQQQISNQSNIQTIQPKKLKKKQSQSQSINMDLLTYTNDDFNLLQSLTTDTNISNDDYAKLFSDLTQGQKKVKYFSIKSNKQVMYTSFIKLKDGLINDMINEQQTKLSKEKEIQDSKIKEQLLLDQSIKDAQKRKFESDIYNLEKELAIRKEYISNGVILVEYRKLTREIKDNSLAFKDDMKDIINQYRASKISNIKKKHDVTMFLSMRVS